MCAALARLEVWVKHIFFLLFCHDLLFTGILILVYYVLLYQDLTQV